MALTAKQARFVEEYLVDLNATQAALRAGYSEKSAHSIGHENLSKPEIAEALQAARIEQQERTQVTADNVIQRLWTEATREGEDASHSARVSALSWLGKHFAAFTDKLEHSGPGGAPLAVNVTRRVVSPDDG